MHDFNTDPDVDLSTLDAHDLLGRANWLKNEATILDEANTKLHNMNDELQKKCDALTSTCEAQHRTISEQSETLENRQKLVDESQSAYTELLEQSESQLEVIESLRQTNEEISSPASSDAGLHMAAELFEGLEAYGIKSARVAANDAHNAVAVAFIQLAARIRSEGWTWYQAISWLRTGK